MYVICNFLAGSSVLIDDNTRCSYYHIILNAMTPFAALAEATRELVALRGSASGGAPGSSPSHPFAAMDQLKADMQTLRLQISQHDAEKRQWLTEQVDITIQLTNQPTDETMLIFLTLRYPSFFACVIVCGGLAGVGATGRDGGCGVGSDPRGVLVRVATAVRPTGRLARGGRCVGGQGPRAAGAAAGAIRLVHTTSTGN